MVLNSDDDNNSNKKKPNVKRKRKRKVTEGDNNMNFDEQEAFRRGVMIAFITTHVEMAIGDIFKRVPALRNMNSISPHAVVGTYIVNIFRKMNEPVPTMEEAMINVDVMKRTAKEVAEITRNKNFFMSANFNHATASGGSGAGGQDNNNNNNKNNNNNNNNNDSSMNNNNKNKKMDFTDKEKEELK